MGRTRHDPDRTQGRDRHRVRPHRPGRRHDRRLTAHPHRGRLLERGAPQDVVGGRLASRCHLRNDGHVLRRQPRPVDDIQSTQAALVVESAEIELFPITPYGPVTIGGATDPYNGPIDYVGLFDPVTGAAILRFP